MLNIHYNIYCLDTNYKPFQSNAADEVDGAAEEDVVQREDKLGEEEGVDVTALAEGPGEH